jgi:hypothetical protein
MSYKKADVEANIEALIEEGYTPHQAIVRAVKTARNQFKKDHIDTLNFPTHLAPGNIYKTYIDGRWD